MCYAGLQCLVHERWVKERKKREEEIVIAGGVRHTPVTTTSFEKQSISKVEQHHNKLFHLMRYLPSVTHLRMASDFIGIQSKFFISRYLQFFLVVPFKSPLII